MNQAAPTSSVPVQQQNLMNPASGVYKSQGSVTFALEIEATFFVTDSLDLAKTTFLSFISSGLFLVISLFLFLFFFYSYNTERGGLV